MESSYNPIISGVAILSSTAFTIASCFDSGIDRIALALFATAMAYIAISPSLLSKQWK